jgi:hypothetical protein
MPDTLSHPWTWTNVPELERSILQGLAETLREGGRFDVGLQYPHDAWKKRYWYGLTVFDSRRWKRVHVCNVYCDGVRLTVVTNIDYSRSETHVNEFDLTEPGSLPQVVARIEALVAQ